MGRHCTCGLYFTRRWLVKYKSPLVQYLTILHSTPCNNIILIFYTYNARLVMDCILAAELASKYNYTLCMGVIYYATMYMSLHGESW